MGMYCCCDQKIRDEWECKCDWEGWVSRYDWPEERNNKGISFSEPAKEGQYVVRVQNGSGDRYEDVQTFYLDPRPVICGYTGKKFEVHWSGNDEEQPYAWRELIQAPEKAADCREKT